PTIVIEPADALAPTLRPTTPTVPEIGATRVAFERSSCADARVCWALSRLALAFATAALLTVVEELELFS
ncbi:hypothetical protein, partial [Sedimentibacter sp. B4]|uniref:hypothetical protein n=1 Tax=Sedimentibacter sp. B4 TaxID=304766 RepID=UPI0018DEAB08